jgi:hypothetical protein
VLAFAGALVVSLSASADAAQRAAGQPPGLDNPALRDGGASYLPGVVIVKFVQRPTLGIQGKPLLTDDLQQLFDIHAVRSAAPVAPGLAPHKATSDVSPGAPDLSRVFVLQFESGEDAKMVAREFAASWDVEYAEPQFVYRLAAAPSGRMLPRVSATATPNDSLYNGDQSVYYDRMDLPTAFADTRGDMGSVVVAIVDGGSEWQHPDLIANVWSNPGETLNGLDDDGNGFVDDVRGWNFANGTNDPTGLAQTPGSAGHGTHVAGIACAATDNTSGVAGASWNAQFMPVCVSHPSVDSAISSGYAGILYAAQAGADIINCSWGGHSNPSSFEQEVIDFAHAQGAVVVAAAGNNTSDVAFYPAAYDHVLAVANLANNDVKIFSSNFGTWVDVSAQGTNILSTSSNGGYAILNGTAMSSPHAAAVCALVKTKYPSYTPDQVAERVRVTSDDIYTINPGYAGELGYGRVNAAQALTKTTPAIRVHDVVVATSDGDAIIEPGETVTLSITVMNHLDAATGASFTLTENSGFVTVTTGVSALPSIGAQQTVALGDLVVDVDASAPINHAIEFTLGMSTTTPSYVDADRFGLRVLPIVATHAANKLVTSITSVGKIGFAEVAGGNGNDGVGFLYDGSANLLFEGAMLMGTGASAISNAARGSNPYVQDADFVTTSDGVPVITDANPPYSEYGMAAFTDVGAASPLNVHVQQVSWQLDAHPNDDFIVLDYTIRNDGESALDGLYVGWFVDWDLDGTSYLSNQTGYDAGRGLGFLWDGSGSGPEAYVGVMTLTTPGTTSYRGIWNDEADPSNPSWGVYDGYTDAEKWASISGGITHTNAGPADVSHAIGTGPFAIAPGEEVTVAFAFLGGTSLANLQDNADAAQSLWDSPTDVADPRLAPRRTRLAQNAPNPFNPSTRIAFELPRTSDVELLVYNVAGRRVRTLIDGSTAAGVHAVVWDGLSDDGVAMPSGTYFYRIRVDGNSLTRKMQLLK